MFTNLLKKILALLPSRRKRWLINPAFQLSFLGYTVGVSFVVGAIYYGATRYFFAEFASQAVEAGIPPGHIFFVFLDSQRATMDALFIISSVLILGVLTGLGLYLSNRVAGPIHNAQEYLLRVAAGQETGSLRFRKKDYFHELAEAINESLQKNKSVESKFSRASRSKVA